MRGATDAAEVAVQERLGWKSVVCSRIVVLQPHRLRLRPGPVAAAAGALTWGTVVLASGRTSSRLRLDVDRQWRDDPVWSCIAAATSGDVGEDNIAPMAARSLTSAETAMLLLPSWAT